MLRRGGEGVRVKRKGYIVKRKDTIVKRKGVRRVKRKLR